MFNKTDAALVLAVVVVILCGIIWVNMNARVPPCPKLVAQSSICAPFGCTHTYVNSKGEDTGECE